MRKFTILLVLGFLFLAGGLNAQNVQLHYDFGKDRSYLTSTVEMFKPDNLGNTFFFVDMDYSVGDVQGVSMAYWEIARVFKTKKMPVGLHLEYDGGFGQYKVANTNFAYQINDALLGGLDYFIHDKDFTKGLTVKLMYKYIRGKHDFSYQATAVWFMHFFNRKLTFTGFADFWREDSFDFDMDGEPDSKFVFLSEPQLWFNINHHLSVGGEVELSYYFAGMEKFQAMPTLGLKYKF